MTSYIVLLRGINVSGQKKIKMTELRDHLINWGFGDVQTYIQSGNLILKYAANAAQQLGQLIKNGISQEYDFDVEVLVWERSVFKRIVNQNPFEDGEELNKKLYFVFLSNPPDLDLVRHLNTQQFENEKFKITPDCIFLNCHQGYGKAKCNNNFFENKLKIKATTRNYRTVKTLIELSK